MPYTYEGKKIYHYGEQELGFIAQHGVQDFVALRNECQKQGKLFEDPEFPAEYSSIFFSKQDNKSLHWRRPSEIAPNPRFVLDGASRFDVVQGNLGNCWFLSALASLTLSKKLFSQIVPDDQNFNSNYAGIFHFRFWNFGRWVDVSIDDRLPTTPDGKLICTHSESANEFWSALLEKAYAKLHGSYEVLKAGNSSEAMQDFTGGITETFNLKDAPRDLYAILQKSFQKGSLMSCHIATQSGPKWKAEKYSNGLIANHSYSITKVKSIQTKGYGLARLLRIRNPWGYGDEWTGAWCDWSWEWKNVSKAEKEELNLNIPDRDGEFWMSYEDFIKNFTHLEMTRVYPNFLAEEDGLIDVPFSSSWETKAFQNSWVKGVNAGGCKEFKDTFHQNPQFKIFLNEADIDDAEKKITIIVSLIQKHLRSQRKALLNIGFILYQIQPSELPDKTRLDQNFFLSTKPGSFSTFIDMREVTCRFKLTPGTYCIVPSTYQPNQETEFMLRVFSEKHIDMEEFEDDVGFEEVAQRILEEAQQSQYVFEWSVVKEYFDNTFKKHLMGDEFSQEICQSMVSMYDFNHTGRLNYKEFVKLWEVAYKWQIIFGSCDKDGLGRLNGFQLRQALAQAGFKVSTRILQLLTLRFGDKNGSVAFKEFMLCFLKIKNLLDIFDEFSSNSTTSATFTKEKFIEKIIYI